ncbi:MAG: transglutaminase family protein [candidate division KSB1 bacterium]|nr:transglutaminase family protein [candidate division KSB1 bacterium]
MSHETHSPEVSPRRIRALIQLLGDEDSEVRKIAREQLLLIGEDATQILDEVVRTDCDGKTRIQARAVLRQINRQELIHAFHLLAMWRDEDISLERAAYLLAKFAYPRLRMSEISTELDRLAYRVSELVDGTESAGDIVHAMNQVLFQEAGFRGNTENYYSVENSFINVVLNKRTGIPITLSLIYMLVAERLKLPIYGVNMPMHFLCMYDESPEPFYIDAFNRGNMMTRAECISFLKRTGVGFRESYLERASNREILVRMLRNLILVYYHNEQDSEAAFLKQLLKILKFYAKR